MSYEASAEHEKLKENRPLSRRGISDTWAQNQNPTTGEEMQTGRPKNTGYGTRPPSTHNLSTRSGSRLSSGIIQPPKTGQSIMNLSYMSVLERPITQQGVTGMQTAASKGSQNRQILDKRYYEGVIRMKMKDIASEIARLNGEIEEETQQQSSSQIYEKRVKEIATELTKLQGELADYNLAIDKINTGADKSQIDMEMNELRNENERLSAELDELFAQNRMKEDRQLQLENEIQNEKDAALKLIQELSESEKKKYDELKKTKDDLQKEIEQYQSQLEALTNQKLEYEDKISGSQVKREIVRLYLKLKEREERKAALIEEEQSRSTPAQEREQLLQKVKEDNLEMGAIERQINEINEEMKKKKKELELIEQDLEENQTERHQKFKELKKREETMENFFLTFEDSKAKENEKIEELEEKIVQVLQRMGKNLLANTSFPSLDEFSVMKENLSIRQEELENSKLTVEELDKKQNQLSSNLKKVDELEQRIQDEISTIHVKMVTMNEEMKTFSNLKELKDRVQEKREELLKEKENLNSQKVSLEVVKSNLQKENENLTKDLNENETYIQLNNLEKKLQFLEQNNKSIKEFIESKKVELNYEPLKNNALTLLKEYNEILMANCN